MPLRPKRISVRPQSIPIHTSPVNMDFEKRRLVVPAGAMPKHKASHEEGGADEIDITGLEGESYEMKILKEELYIDSLRDDYASIMANERYSSNRRGFEIR